MIKKYKIHIISIFGLLGLGSCHNIEKLQHTPPVLSVEWCQHQPCWTYKNIIISQPTSSILVYFLAVLTLWVAYYFYKTRNGQKSRYWWGISLTLGGLGAAAAGASFQAFGYMIKCAGKANCSLTSWWEVVYNILTVGGAGALLIAISYTCMPAKGQKWSRIYALCSTSIYTVICLTGAFLPNAFLVSFETMILATLPAYFVIIGLNIFQYKKSPSPVLARLLVCWAILLIVFCAYYWYALNGYTQKLWQQGIWFSENDVLHVMMLFWCLYVYVVLGKWIGDNKLNLN